MNSSNAIGHAVRLASYAGAVTALAGLAPAALAQQAADSAPIEEITVTGSRIIRQDYNAASPISTVDSQLFEDTGSPTIESVLNTLPQFVPSITSTSNNPSNGGQANVSLRGLGTQRTLVLLDGRRIVPSNPTGVVDLNLIPASIIKNVEIITGGASAVYGSDAIAGVVNIKTRDFTGLELSSNYGITGEDDGERLNVGITGGLDFADGRGYAFGTLNYADRKGVLQGDRAFSAVSLDWNEDAQAFEPFGSSTIRQGRWDAISSNAPSQAAVDSYFAARATGYSAGDAEPGDNFGFNPDSSLFVTTPVINFTGDMNEPLQPVNPNGYSYNFAPPNYLELPLERNSFFGRAGYDVTEDTEVFAQVLWADYEVAQALAPTPATRLYLRPDNPNLPADVQALLATRPDPTAPFRFRKRMIETGPRISRFEYDVSQVVLGARGDLGFAESWEWDVYAALGNVESEESQEGNVSRSAFYEVALAPDHGVSVCGSAINPFGIDSISPECAAHFQRSALNTEDVEQQVIEGFVRGPVFEMPAGDAQTALGVMYKKDEYEFLPDESLRQAINDPVFPSSEIVDIVGFNAQDTVIGETDSTEFYLEANFPILRDAPAAQTLDFTLGGRLADHSVSGNMSSYKAEGIWGINDLFTVRGGFQRAVRAPNISELFRPATINFPRVGLGDPCSNDFESDGNVLGAQDDPRARALCVEQGIPDSSLDAYVFENNQFQGLSGGNPDLEEETADTFTLGLVFNGPVDGPLAGLQGSLDFYDITIEDKIDAREAATIVERCFDPRHNPDMTNGNFWCGMFSRDAGTGGIVDVSEIDANIGTNEIRGIDAQIEYAADVGPGMLDIKWIATRLVDWEEAQIQGEELTDFAGTASSQFDVLPEWKWTTAIDYAVGNFDTTLRWQHIGATNDQSFPGFKLEATEYYDLSLGYNFAGFGMAGLRVRGGVHNLTDEEPVIYPSNQQSNTDPASYDVLGRRYFVSAAYSFE